MPSAVAKDPFCPAGVRADWPADLVDDPVVSGSWFVDVASHVPSAPPTDDEALELQELLRLQAARTPELEASARRWAEGTASAPWEAVLLEMIPKHVTFEGKGNVPRLARHLGVFETAMYDAILVATVAQGCYARAPPAHPDLQPIVPGDRTPSYPSLRATVAGAASILLESFFPNETRGFTTLAREAAESRLVAGLEYRSDIEAGLALGESIARDVLRARANDGFESLDAEVPRPQAPCAWTELAPNFTKPTAPLAGKMRPFLLTTGNQFRPLPPPVCGDSAFLAETRSLYEASYSLTPEQRESAASWEGGRGTSSPPGMWIEIARNASTRHGLSNLEHARLMAHVGAALADAGIAAWDAKYAYWTERPIHTIHREWDAGWQPIILTPDFPGYVSGHSTFSGAASTVLASAFPTDAATFEAQAHDAMMSRFWGGIHIMSDNTQGLALGQKVGATAVAHMSLDATSPGQR